jgi:dihydroorotate dehydrogenase (fumarate)
MIGKIEISSPVMNAACSVAKTLEDIEALSKTNIGVVTIGSITVSSRDGNPEPRWFDGTSYALNSFGMPNEGLEYYRQHLPAMIDTIHASGKKASLSVAGFSAVDYAELAAMAEGTAIDFLELNLGCPNVQIDGKQKPIASFDTDYIKEIVTSVSEVCSKPLMLKLSPYSNPGELQRVASLIASLDRVVAIVTSNTFANSFMIHDGQPVLASTFGGFSGKALLPIALGQVKQFRDHLPESVAIIGVGGIESSDDAKLFIEAGASAVQVATLIVRDGHHAINEVTL